MVKGVKGQGRQGVYAVLETDWDSEFSESEKPLPQDFGYACVDNYVTSTGDRKRAPLDAFNQWSQTPFHISEFDPKEFGINPNPTKPISLESTTVHIEGQNIVEYNRGWGLGNFLIIRNGKTPKQVKLTFNIIQCYYEKTSYGDYIKTSSGAFMVSRKNTTGSVTLDFSSAENLNPDESQLFFVKLKHSNEFSKHPTANAELIWSSNQGDKTQARHGRIRWHHLYFEEKNKS